jgi:hypothetical protein
MIFKSINYKLIALPFVVAGLVFSLPASAKTYKWVDDKGTTHYGETIPAEYANKDRALLNKSGVVIEKQEVLTPAERRTKEAGEAKVRDEAAQARDQRRHDKSLTDSYNSLEEIELSRTRSLQQVDARINSIGSQLKMDNNNLQSLQKDAASRSAAGGKVPAGLQDEIKEAQARAKRTQQDLDKYKADKLIINTRYDEDKARYKELTGK